MKKITILLFMLYSVFGYNQSIDTLYIGKCEDVNWTSHYRNFDKFKTIKFEDGSSIHLGDIIKIGKPSKNNLLQKQKRGFFTSVKSTENSFSYLILGRIGIAMMSGIYAPEKLKNIEATVIEIKILHKNISKNSPVQPILVLEVNGATVSVLNFKLAFENGELINPTSPVNRSEANAKLKEQKKLLDLGIITKEDFNKLKEKLKPLLTK